MYSESAGSLVPGNRFYISIIGNFPLHKLGRSLPSPALSLSSHLWGWSCPVIGKFISQPVSIWKTCNMALLISKAFDHFDSLADSNYDCGSMVCYDKGIKNREDRQCLTISDSVDCQRKTLKTLLVDIWEPQLLGRWGIYQHHFLVFVVCAFNALENEFLHD